MTCPVFHTHPVHRVFAFRVWWTAVAPQHGSTQILFPSVLFHKVDGVFPQFHDFYTFSAPEQPSKAITLPLHSLILTEAAILSCQS